jgi:Icc-related predicted phosphoesterase
MIVLYTSDIHAHPGHLQSLLDAAEREMVDAVIIGGDLIPHALPDTERIDLIDRQRRYLKETLIPAAKRLIIRTRICLYVDLGNDDLYASRRILEEYDGKLLNLLHMRKHPFTDAVDIIGYMNVPPTPFRRKDWEKPDSSQSPYARNNRVRLEGYITRTGKKEDITLDIGSGDTIEKDLSLLSERIHRPFIFVAHSPPYDTPLDVLDNGVHVGSSSIRAFIQAWARKGLLVASLHGHIHESPFRSGRISTRIEEAICINPGQHAAGDRPLRYVILKLSHPPVHLEIIKPSSERQPSRHTPYPMFYEP